MVDYEGMGLPADLDVDVMDGCVEVGGDKHVSFPGAEGGMQGLLAADVREYHPSTPSYGLDEQ